MNKPTISRLLATVAVGASIYSGSVLAQETQAASELTEVVVSASRIQRSGFEAPSPVTVIGVEQMEARAATNVADVLNEIPAFRPTKTPQSNAIGGGFGGNIVDLRGLGTTRTLVLINGHRHVPVTVNGEVDLNLIPSSLIERTEVVTGGASAAWGSDAVAGVVNMVLKDKLQGIVGNVSYGQTDKNDNKSYNGSIAGGTDFAGGRGHIIAGAEYDKIGGVGDTSTARKWSAQMWGTVGLSPARAAGLPAFYLSPNVRFNGLADAGLITGCSHPGSSVNFCPSLTNTTFLPNGLPTPFVVGSIASASQMVGGSDNRTFSSGLNVFNPVQRSAGLVRVSFDVTPSFNVFAELNLAKTNQYALSAGHILNAPISIKNDNAFLPAALKAQLATLNEPAFNLGRFDSEIGRYQQHSWRDTKNALVGFKGELPHGWSWDGYYLSGTNNSVNDVLNMVLVPNYLAATDAVVVNGQVVCRSLTTSRGPADPGCVPFNVFGVGAPSAAALSYVIGDKHDETYNREQVGAVNLRGEPVSIWAGPISLAVGAEWRKESTDVISNASSAASRFDFNNVLPITGSYNVKEAYLETVVPLVKDLGFIKSADLNAAGRRTDYSIAGYVSTWKLGATIEDSSGQVRLRATKSRDIRAPNLGELFAASTSSTGNISNPLNRANALLTETLTSGNTALQPEKADTLTYGAVLSPNFVPGFRISADYYRIDIANVIATYPSQTIVDRCIIGGATDLCPRVLTTGFVPINLATFTGSTPITRVLSNSLNLNRLKTSGVDIEASYRVPLDKLNTPGNLTLRLLGTRVFELVTTDSGGPTDRVKQTVPLWSGTLNVNYALNKFGTNLTVRYIGATLIDATHIGPDDPAYSPTLALSTNINLRPAVTYADLSAQYTLKEEGSGKLVLYGVVNNLFDREPPFGGGGNLTGPSLYDLTGRFMRVGVRFNY